MVTLMQPLHWYNNELNIQIPGVIISTGQLADAEGENVINESEAIPVGNNIETEQSAGLVSSNESDDIKSNGDVVIIGSDSSKNQGKYTDFDRAIAAFVFEYETFQLSRCEKTDAERVSIIGEDVILVAEKVEGHSLGYKFSARSCTLRDYP
jgi:hypothetical protein